jgi:hypothetical protein
MSQSLIQNKITAVYSDRIVVRWFVFVAQQSGTAWAQESNSHASVLHRHELLGAAHLQRPLYPSPWHTV